MSKFCKCCGTLLKITFKYCPICGQRHVASTGETSAINTPIRSESTILENDSSFGCHHGRVREVTPAGKKQAMISLNAFRSAKEKERNSFFVRRKGQKRSKVTDAEVKITIAIMENKKAKRGNSLPFKISASATVDQILKAAILKHCTFNKFSTPKSNTYWFLKMVQKLKLFPGLIFQNPSPCAGTKRCPVLVIHGKSSSLFLCFKKGLMIWDPFLSKRTQNSIPVMMTCQMTCQLSYRRSQSNIMLTAHIFQIQRNLLLR